MENKTHFDVYKLPKQLVNSKNHTLAGGSWLNRLGMQAADQKSAREAGKSCKNSRPRFVLPLCHFSQGSPAEYLTEQNFALQGLTKIFLKGYEVQCFSKRELKIFCAHKIMALRVQFIHLDPFQHIPGKTNIRMHAIWKGIFYKYENILYVTSPKQHHLTVWVLKYGLHKDVTSVDTNFKTEFNKSSKIFLLLELDFQLF